MYETGQLKSFHHFFNEKIQVFFRKPKMFTITMISQLL